MTEIENLSIFLTFKDLNSMPFSSSFESSFFAARVIFGAPTSSQTETYKISIVIKNLLWSKIGALIKSTISADVFFV